MACTGATRPCWPCCASEAQQRGVPSCVLTFEPHPRDYFAALRQKPELAPARVGTLRDKLDDLAKAGVDQTIVLPFDAGWPTRVRKTSSSKCCRSGLGARYVLVGDDFRFVQGPRWRLRAARRAGEAHGFDVARMNSYEVHGLRVSSSAVRDALRPRSRHDAARLLGRAVLRFVATWCTARKLGRSLGFRTPEPALLRTGSPPPAAFSWCWCMAWPHKPLHGVCQPGRAALARTPTTPTAGALLLETHCLDWPDALGAEGAYGKLIRVELLHKLHDELQVRRSGRLTQGIRKDRTTRALARSDTDFRRHPNATGLAFAPPTHFAPSPALRLLHRATVAASNCLHKASKPNCHD